jgi:hypothetical protein
VSTHTDLINDPAVDFARSNVSACAYNAAVNSDTPRGVRKMHDLIHAINRCQRIEGYFLLRRLVDKGIITSFTPCPEPSHPGAQLYGADLDGCEMRPGGLFHVVGCENDSNHPVYKARQQKAREELPGGPSGDDGWYAASVHLVGNGR